jgi:hypothetical protein
MNTHLTHNSHTTPNKIHSSDVVMPGREQVLLDTLRDSSLVWQSAHKRDSRSWRSGGGSDPFRPNLDPLSERELTPTNSGISKRSLEGDIGLDWHTVEESTLTTQTEDHDVILQKTLVNSYSHQVRKSMNRRSYTAEFVSRHDKDQRCSLNDSTCPAVRDLFEELSAKIQ